MEKRGFENPDFLIKWHSFHPDAKNYFPSRLVYNKNGAGRTLYITPINKIAGVSFAYIKKDLLYSINVVNLFRDISEISLSKSDTQ